MTKQVAKPVDEFLNHDVHAEKVGHQDRLLALRGALVIGFTGTRNGMTAKQQAAVHQLLTDLKVTAAHHGDCIGADEQFHGICREHKVPVVLHPPQDERLRAYCEGWSVIHRPLPYLQRNRRIVDASGLLLAAPKETDEPPPARGQGTWSTVRYARKSDRLLRILWPE